MSSLTSSSAGRRHCVLSFPLLVGIFATLCIIGLIVMDMMDHFRPPKHPAVPALKTHYAFKYSIY